MLRFPKSMCVLVLLLVAVPAYAQRGGGRGGRSTRAAIEYIGVAAVQEELGVTAEQKSKLAEIAAKIQEERSASFRGRGGGQSFRDLSDAERAKFLAERAQQRAELSKKIVSTYKPQVAAVLDTAQMERLQQIGWQAMGLSALQNEAMVKTLELSKEAQDKIAAAMSDYSANAPRFGRGGGGGGTSREERQALQTKRDDAMMAALTDAQKEAFAKLKGKAFDVSVLTQRGQGRGGQGRRGGGNNN